MEYFRNQGLEVYDFRNPAEDDQGFHWSEIDEGYHEWTSDEYIDALGDEIAQKGFATDMQALQEADLCVLVLPCGKSAHLELGWAAGAGKETAIYLPPDEKPIPELMYSMADIVTDDLDALIAWMKLERS